MKTAFRLAAAAITSTLLLAAAPATAGPISGTVKAASTEALLAGVTVEIYDESGYSLVDSATTDAQGQYAVTGLSSGTYYVRTQNGLGYADEIYDGYPCIPQLCYNMSYGTPVTVTGGTPTTGIDFSLTRSGSISGTVRDAATLAPLAGVQLFAMGGEWIPLDATNAQGHYSIEGLPAGTYYLVATNSQGYVDELYDNVPCPDGWCSQTLGTGIVVVAGAATPGVDFGLSHGGSISGRIEREETHAPLASVEIRVEDANGVSGWAATDILGQYTISGLPAGTYRLTTWNDQGYVDERYNDVPCPNDTCSSTAGIGVVVTAQADASGIDFTLQVGGTIAGSVEDSTAQAGIPGTRVYVYDAAHHKVASAQTDSEGLYAATGLPAGTYHVRTFGAAGNFVDEAYDNVPCPRESCSPGTGTGVPVALGVTTSGIDFSLARAGEIAGTVLDGGTQAALVGVNVEVSDGNGIVLTRTTNATGQYSVKGLPSGTYRVRTTNASGYVDELYDDIPCPGGSCQMTSATAVVVTAEATTGGIDFALGHLLTLDVVRTGSGSGSVSSSPAGIDCGADCTETYPLDQAVTLTATPTSGSTFAGWGGACAGTQLTCQLTMNAPKAVTAAFDSQPVNHTLTVTRTGIGSGTVTSSPAGIDCGLDCTQSYLAGTSVSLTATPAAGSTFLGWSGACTGLTCTVSMNAGKTATASFDLVGEPITWERFIGTEADSNTLKRTTGSGWNAGAVSNKVLASGDGYVEYTLPATPGYAMFGLSHGDTDGSYADIDYALYTYPATSQLMAFEKGVYKGTFGTFATGDVLRVSVESGVVTYRKNGQFLGSSEVLPTYPLLADSSLYSPGSNLADAQMAGVLDDRAVMASTDVVWRNAVKVTAASGLLTRENTTGWNGGASSAQELASGDGYTEYRVASASSYVMFGLSHGDSNQGYADIDYAIYAYPGTSQIMVYEAGTYRIGLGSYAVNDILRVAVENGVITYSRNGVQLYASAIPPAYPLVTDTCLYSPNAVLADAKMGGDLREIVSWTHLNKVQVVGDALTRSAAGGWNAGAISSRRIATGNGGAQYVVADMATYAMFGLGHGDTDAGYADIEYAIYTYPPTSQVLVYESGSFRGSFGTYAAGDTLRVSVEDGVVSYWKNGGLFYTSLTAPTYPLVLDVSLSSGRIEGARLTGNLSSVPVVEQDVTWSALVSVTAVGATLQRSQGFGWNAGAVSTQTLTADGYVEYDVSSASAMIMFGLGNGDTSQGFDDIEYAIYTYPGTGQLYIYESGVYRAAGGSYTVGDKLRVAVEGGMVKYQKNGALVYSSALAPTYPLSVDTSLYSPGAVIAGARIGREE